jgi:uncharacterized membrane protein
MHASPFHHLLYSWPILIVLGVVFALLIALIELNVIRYAYERMGISRRYVFLLLFASLAGSYVNIPVAKVTEQNVAPQQFIRRFGIDYYLVPDVEQSSTTIAVNLGGAVIPTLLSIYLIIRNKLFLRGLIGVAIVTIIVHWLAYPVQGVGIAVPIFIPPIAAALVAVALAQIPISEPLATRGTVPFSSSSSSPSTREGGNEDDDRGQSPLTSVAPALAYVIGSLGTLIGADLLNLGNIQGLGAPIASIGGAGTFDGIFLTGILAVLLA